MTPYPPCCTDMELEDPPWHQHKLFHNRLIPAVRENLTFYKFGYQKVNFLKVKLYGYMDKYIYIYGKLQKAFEYVSWTNESCVDNKFACQKTPSVSKFESNLS
jgi:hypothetical protein